MSQHHQKTERQPKPEKLPRTEACSGIGRMVIGEAFEQSARDIRELARHEVVPTQMPAMLYYGQKVLGAWGLRGGDELLDKLKDVAGYNPDISENELTVTLGRFKYMSSHRRLRREIHFPPQLMRSEVNLIYKTMVGENPNGRNNFTSLCIVDEVFSGETFYVDIGAVYGVKSDTKEDVRACIDSWQGWTPQSVTLSPLQAIPRPVQPGEMRQPVTPGEQPL